MKLMTKYTQRLILAIASGRLEAANARVAEMHAIIEQMKVSYQAALDEQRAAIDAHHKIEIELLD